MTRQERRRLSRKPHIGVRLTIDIERAPQLLTPIAPTPQPRVSMAPLGLALLSADRAGVDGQ
jgi:hypothetical protein